MTEEKDLGVIVSEDFKWEKQSVLGSNELHVTKLQ